MDEPSKSETVQLTRSKSHPGPNVIDNYYSGDRYYSGTTKSRIKRYSSFTPGNNGTRNSFNFRKKAYLSSTTTPNVPFSQYTPHPHYNILTNQTISSMNFDIDINNIYINSKDDISDTSSLKNNDEFENDINNTNNHELSSNCSFSSSQSVIIGDASTDSIINKSNKNGTNYSLLQQIKEDNDETKHHPLLGMILVTISAICYAALNLSVGALMTQTPWQELMFIRMTVTWIATLIWIFIRYRGRLSLCGPKHQRCLLSLRAFFLWGAMFTCWWSFEFLPVGDGTTLQMSFPFVVSVIAHFVWSKDGDGVNSQSQRLDKFGWFFVLAGLLGVAFVAQPSFIFGGISSDNRDIGIIIGCASAVCAGAQYIIVNYTKEDCHWLQVEQLTAGLSTFVFCPLGAIAFGIYYYASYTGNDFTIPWDILNTERWFEEIALGLLGFTALALLTRGSQLDAPARTSICLYLMIPFTYLGQSILSHTVPNTYVFIGIFLVLCSVIIPAIRKLRKANKLKQMKASVNRNIYEDRYMKSDETIPLLNDNDVIDISNTNYKGVTIEWSSSYNSSDINDNDDDNVVL